MSSDEYTGWVAWYNITQRDKSNVSSEQTDTQMKAALMKLAAQQKARDGTR